MAFLKPCPAVSNDCLTTALLKFLAASVVVSLIALVAKSVNCLVSAPHHCSGSTRPVLGDVAATSALRAGLDARAFFLAVSTAAGGSSSAASWTSGSRVAAG